MAKKKSVEINYNPNWTIWFEKYVINSKTKTEWIDVVGPTGYRSFYPEQLKGIIKPKRKRKKKNV